LPGAPGARTYGALDAVPDRHRGLRLIALLVGAGDQLPAIG
jgi:hypothetical protein